MGRDFETMLRIGNRFEDEIVKWLQRHDWKTYKMKTGECSAPCFEGRLSALTACDILAVKGGKSIWLEAKEKRRMEFHPATGFANRLWGQYNAIQDTSGIPVFLLFADDISGKTQLYGNSISNMAKHVYRIMRCESDATMLFRVPDGFYEITYHDSFDELIRKADEQGPCNFQCGGRYVNERANNAIP